MCAKTFITCLYIDLRKEIGEKPPSWMGESRLGIRVTKYDEKQRGRDVRLVNWSNIILKWVLSSC